MDPETQHSNQQQTHPTPFLKLPTKAIKSQPLPTASSIIYAMSNNKICIVDHQHSQIVYQTQQQIHQNRIGCMQYKDNLLITGGYDNLVKIFDCRNWQLVHTFQKIPSKFTSIDKSQHILAGSTNTNIIFWDLKKMKQRSQFKESFNGQITCIRFQSQISTNLMGCSIDGMINMFDLTQPNQQEAFNWCYKILQAPQGLSVGKNGSALIRTVDHNIYNIMDGDLIRKIIPNTPQLPKHVLLSQFKPKSNYEIYQYFAWLPQQKIIEHWSANFFNKNEQEKCNQYLNYVHDIEILDILYSNNGRCVGIYTDQEGNVYKNYFTHQRKLYSNNVKQSQNQQFQVSNLSKKGWNFSKNDSNKKQVQPKGTNKNGYIIQKPASSFSNHKKFKPY